MAIHVPTSGLSSSESDMVIIVGHGLRGSGGKGVARWDRVWCAVGDSARAFQEVLEMEQRAGLVSS